MVGCIHMKKSQSGFIGIAVLMIVVLGLLSGYVFYYVNNKSEVSESEVSTSPNSISSSKSESSEKTNIVADTTVTANISSIEGNKITLDYFDFLVGVEAEKAVVADGVCTQKEVDDHNGCFPNGVIYFRNQNPKLRTFTLAGNAQVLTASAFEKDPDDIINISVQDLKKDYVDKRTINGERIYMPYEVTFNNKGEVGMIEEIFRP
jgi:hypothetical protein